MKMIQGFFYLAISNSFFINFSDSSTNLEIKSELEMLKKVEFSTSVAQALVK